MSEFNILLINYDIIKLHYTHEGIFGKGVDILIDQPCTLHLMKSKSLKEEEGKLFVMQVYSSLQTDIFYRKLDQLAKSFYQFCSPFQLPIRHLSFKKNEETKLYDLYVMYEFHNLDNEGKSLQEQLYSQQPPAFNEEQLWQLVHTLVDQIYMGGRLSYEYLDINPWNIYFRDSAPIIANFGLQQHPKFTKKLFCYQDRLFQKNSSIGNQSERLIDMYMRSYIFALGMLIMYAGLKEDPNSLYTENNNQIRPDLLQKRIELFKTTFPGKLSNLIQLCLQIKEEKRLDIEELIGEKGSELLNREITYYQGKLEGSEFYSGFVKIDATSEANKKVKMGVGEFLMENKQLFKGMFANGERNGYGIWYDNEQKFAAGTWKQDNIQQGLLIQKNKYLYFGQLQNLTPNGIGTMIALQSNTFAQFYIFEGVFDSNGNPQTGRTLLKDGQIVDEIPQIEKAQDQSQEQQSEILQME